LIARASLVLHETPPMSEHLAVVRTRILSLRCSQMFGSRTVRRSLIDMSVGGKASKTSDTPISKDRHRLCQLFVGIVLLQHMGLPTSLSRSVVPRLPHVLKHDIQSLVCRARIQIRQFQVRIESLRRSSVVDEIRRPSTALHRGAQPGAMANIHCFKWHLRNLDLVQTLFQMVASSRSSRTVTTSNCIFCWKIGMARYWSVRVMLMLSLVLVDS
jgi:hypothetical protein